MTVLSLGQCDRVLSFIPCIRKCYQGPGGSVVKNPPAKQETDSIPGLGRSPGEGNGNPFQYSCLGNPMDRGAWRATVHGVAKSRT